MNVGSSNPAIVKKILKLFRGFFGFSLKTWTSALQKLIKNLFYLFPGHHLLYFKVLEVQEATATIDK